MGGDQTRLCHPCVRADDQPCPSSRDAGRAWCDIAHDAGGGTALRGSFNARYRRTGTLWEGRFKAALVDTASYVLACYRYIELNPVRAMMANLTPFALRD